MKKVSEKDINALSKVYHELIYAYQKGQHKFFSNKLKGITTVEVSILEIVDKYPNIILKEILDILQIPNSTLTNVINRLEKKNLIRRVINQRDKRSFGLELTEEGIEAQKEHKRDEYKLFSHVLASLDEEERTAFIASLTKIAKNFDL